MNKSLRLLSLFKINQSPSLSRLTRTMVSSNRIKQILKRSKRPNSNHLNKL